MTVIKTVLFIAIVAIVGIVNFVYSGVYNVAADELHWGLTRWMLETTREKSVETRMGNVIVPENLADSQRYRRGAQSYAKSVISARASNRHLSTKA